MFPLFAGGGDKPRNEKKTSHALQGKAGTLPAFYLPLRAHFRTPPRRNRHAAPFPRQPAFGPPDDRHPRTKRFHPPSTWRPQKHRNPRAAGKLADPRMARYQNVKITVMNH